MNDKVLYVSDMDGTLLNKDGKISSYTRDKLNELINNGLCFSVATARPLIPVIKMLNGVNINTPIILLNGVLIYDIMNKKVVNVNKISKLNAEIIIQAMRKFNVSGFMYEINANGDLQVYHEFFKGKDVPLYLIERAKKYNSINSKNGLLDNLSDNIVYFTIIDSYNSLIHLAEFFKSCKGVKVEFYENVYQPEFWFLEVFNEFSSKKNAIDFLKQEFKYNMIVGFGDNYNDLTLFESCDLSVAVENAVVQLKEKADYICDSNDEDGVVRWIEKNLDQI